MFRLIEVISRYEKTQENPISKEFDRKFKRYDSFLSLLEPIEISVPKRKRK